MKLTDLTDLVYGKLTVLYRDTTRKRTIWVCRCTCGTIKAVAAANLKSGNTTSCGCFALEAKRSRKKHGDTCDGKRSSEHRIWTSMIERCHNNNSRAYKWYGARGIVVCDAWRTSFATFLSDVGRRPGKEYSIDRFPDNNGNYEPGNVRWATRKEQANNTRSNRLVTAWGKTQNVSQWARELNVKASAVYARLARGWSDENALVGQANKVTCVRSET